MSVQLLQLEKDAQITKEALIDLLEDPSVDEAVFAAADRVRKQTVGDAVHLRGLIEFSNICKQNCFFRAHTPRRKKKQKRCCKMNE